MADLQFQIPITEEVEVDDETLAAIDRGLADADTGRTLPIAEVRNEIPAWLSKFESRKQH